MGKHLSFIRFKFILSLQFRTEIIVWMILDLLPFLVILFTWAAIYQNTDTLNGLTLPQMLSYYLIASFIQGVSGTHFERWRAEEIRLGKIDFFLIRPFSYLKEVFLSDIAGKLFYLCLFTPLYALFFILVMGLFELPMGQVKLFLLVQFLALLVLAYLVEFFIALLIVLLSFWFEGSEGLEHFKWISITLFSGALVPVEFMPAWLKKIVEFLPIQLLYRVPIEILQGRRELSISISLYATGFLLCLMLLSYFTWRKAVRRYASAGG